MKFKPHSNHLFSTVLTKSDKSCNNDDEIKKLAESVRNDMEHLHQGFKILNENVKATYLVSEAHLTMLDLMIYNEISQVLFFYHHFKAHSRSAMYKKFTSANPDWEEQDELKEYKQLADWYNKTMKSSDAYPSLKKFDMKIKNDIDFRFGGNQM